MASQKIRWKKGETIGQKKHLNNIIYCIKHRLHNALSDSETFIHT